jgi:hypothetical protein
LISFGKLADFDSAIRRFDPSRPSQAVRRSEKMSLTLAERPANGRLLRIRGWSPDSEIGIWRREIAESLRRIIEIFPFLGDSDRRPGLIGTAWRGGIVKPPVGDANSYEQP